eukprot:m.42960 g.42960  ORF g.42960 m.42960 type:complete len:227 (-) comp14623_c0_seq1:242-922(-)
MAQSAHLLSVWTPPADTDFARWRDYSIEEPDTADRYPTRFDLETAQQALAEAFGAADMMAVTTALLRFWHNDVISAATDVMAIMVNIKAENAVALLLLFAKRLGGLQPDFSAATSAVEERALIQAHVATLPAGDELVFRFMLARIGIGPGTVLDVLLGLAIRRLLICDAATVVLSEADRAVLVELVEDYLGEWSDLKGVWETKWEKACTDMPNHHEALVLFLEDLG